MVTEMTDGHESSDTKNSAEGPPRAQRRGQALGFALGSALGLVGGIAGGVLVREQCEWGYFGQLMALVVPGGVGFFVGAVLGAIVGKRLSRERGKP